MRKILFIAVALVLLCLVVSHVDAAGKYGRKGKSSSGSKSSTGSKDKKIEVELDDATGDVKKSTSKPAKAADYKDCESCVEAGNGWSHSSGKCGEYLNTECDPEAADDEDDEEVDSESSYRPTKSTPPASQRQESYDDDNITPGDTSVEQPWTNTEKTTHLWQVISSGNIDNLRSMLKHDPDAALVRSEDGRGPLFWAYEYSQPKMVELLLKYGADPKAEDEDGKKPVSFSTQKQAVKRTTTDVNEQLNQYTNCNDCVGAGYGWCTIQRTCGGFENKHCPDAVEAWKKGFEPKRFQTRA